MPEKCGVPVQAQLLLEMKQNGALNKCAKICSSF